MSADSEERLPAAAGSLCLQHARTHKNYAKLAVPPSMMQTAVVLVLLGLLLTHLAPDRPSPPALLPYRTTPDRPVAASQQTLHTSISAYANRNGILVRRVASFPLLFTTSGDVLCSKFERHCEFSKLRSGHAIDARK